MGAAQALLTIQATKTAQYQLKCEELQAQNAKLRTAVEACLLRFRDLERREAGDLYAEHTAAIKYLESVLEVK